MGHSLILISIVFIFLSCNSNDQTKSSVISIKPIDSAKLARQKEKEKYFAEQATSLNLLPISNGVDSFELRLWVGSMFVEHDLLILTYKNANWESHKIRYYKSEDGITHFKEEKIKTNFSINNLTDSLKFIDFDNFISQDEIKNFRDNVADGVTYNLEIATKNSYKLLTYHCPEYFAKTETDNKKFLDIIFLLDKHFSFLAAHLFGLTKHSLQQKVWQNAGLTEEQSTTNL